MPVLGITADAWTAPIPVASPFPLVAWHTAFWASDPAWAHPADGAAVTTWRDGTNNGHTVTTSGGAPVWRASASTLNGCPAVEFDGVDDEMVSSNFTELGSFAFVVVARCARTTGRNVWMGGSGASMHPMTGITDAAWTADFNSGGTANTARHLLHTNFAASASFIAVDGVQVATGWPSAGGPANVKLARYRAMGTGLDAHDIRVRRTESGTAHHDRSGRPAGLVPRLYDTP